MKPTTFNLLLLAGVGLVLWIVSRKLGTTATPAPATPDITVNVPPAPAAPASPAAAPSLDNTNTLLTAILNRLNNPTGGTTTT